jgi:hypothetical protein
MTEWRVADVCRKVEEGGSLVKKLVLLATAALVAMLILVPTAMAQTDTDVVVERTIEMESTAPLPKSGGPLAPSALLLPAAALLLGSGVVVYAFVRRR